MSIYHLSIKIISRSGGRTAVASAAYRSGEKLYNEETGSTHDFTRKKGVVHKEIILPECAPQEYYDREVLWNAVQKVEKRCDAQFAREIEVAFPIEMTREEQLECVRNYIKKNFIMEGMIADFAIHDTGKGNPHAHIMLTVRGLDENANWMKKEKSVFANARDDRGRPIYNPDLPSYDPKNREATSKYRIPALDENGKQKTRIRKGKGTEYLWEKINIPMNDWNDHSKAEMWRASWAEECNKYLSQDKHIDHRAYKRQGIDMEPTIHEGIIARKREANGKIADRCEMNREVRERNSIRIQIRQLAKEITEIVLMKARDLIERINRFTRGTKYTGVAGAIGDSPRKTRGRVGGVEDRKSAISGTARGIRKYQQFINDADKKLSDISREIAATDIRIRELKAVIKQKEEEQNERIRKLMERRRAFGYSGTTGESNRRLPGEDCRVSEDTEEFGKGVSTEDIRSGLTNTTDEVRKLIYDLGTKERIAEEKREDSTAKRENREAEQKRQGTSRSEKASSRSSSDKEGHRSKINSDYGGSR